MYSEKAAIWLSHAGVNKCIFFHLVDHVSFSFCLSFILSLVMVETLPET